MIYCYMHYCQFSVEDELTVEELIIAFVEELVGRVEMVEVTKETKRRASSSLSISSH